MAMATSLLCILSMIISISLASVNIDCGTSTSNIDNNGINWVGDKGFITTGDSATVSSSSAIEESLTTLRYFPTGKSNCYSNILVTKGEKVLVRTLFYYGNYDGKFSSPSFNVVFDGKHERTMAISVPFESNGLEVIFAPTSGETSVCFVRTSSASNPFVSSIEVVDLATGMYEELGPDEGFFYHVRVAYDLPQFIRSDDYGRFWNPSGPSPWSSRLTSMATTIDTTNASNKPPESILRNSWSGEGLSLGADRTLPVNGVPIYLAMYFSNPSDSNLLSFNILFNGKQVNKSPVMPVYGTTTQIVVRDVASSSSLLVLRSTLDSVFPPLINALEVYVISNGTSNGPGGDRDKGGGAGGDGDKGGGGERDESGSGNGNGGGDESNKLSKGLGIGIPVCVVSAIVYGVWRYMSSRRKRNNAMQNTTVINQRQTICCNCCYY